jgi:hypothetical protein
MTAHQELRAWHNLVYGIVSQHMCALSESQEQLQEVMARGCLALSITSPIRRTPIGRSSGSENGDNTRLRSDRFELERRNWRVRRCYDCSIGCSPFPSACATMTNMSQARTRVQASELTEETCRVLEANHEQSLHRQWKFFESFAASFGSIED